MLFEVYNPGSGHSLGFWEAEEAEEAIEACCKAAGYGGAAEALEARETGHKTRVFEIPGGCQIAISAEWDRCGSPIHVAGYLAPFVLGDPVADTRRALIWGLVRFGVVGDREEAEAMAEASIEVVAV